MKAATQRETPHIIAREISIHAAREGGDTRPTRLMSLLWTFQSTPPVKAATFRHAFFRLFTAISIHAAREGGDYPDIDVDSLTKGISIHAAREGGDRKRQGYRLPRRISIHAAREGGDMRTHLRRRND